MCVCLCVWCVCVWCGCWPCICPLSGGQWRRDWRVASPYYTSHNIWRHCRYTQQQPSSSSPSPHHHHHHHHHRYHFASPKHSILAPPLSTTFTLSLTLSS